MLKIPKHPVIKISQHCLFLQFDSLLQTQNLQYSKYLNTRLAQIIPYFSKSSVLKFWNYKR